MIETNAMESPFFIIEEKPYEVELFKDYYVNKDMLSNLKTTNKILNVVAGVYTQENGYANCLLVNTDKKVVEAINGNLFLVKGNQIKTPPLSDGCLDGIIRKNLMKLIAGSEDYDLVETPFRRLSFKKWTRCSSPIPLWGFSPSANTEKRSTIPKLPRVWWVN